LAAVCLVSETGPTSTVIDGTHTGRCIYLSSVPSPGVLIQGFTVYNGNLEWWADWEKDTGAGIFAHASAFNIHGNVIRENYGGGIACDAASSGIIADNEIRENTGGDIEPPYPVLGPGIVTRSSNLVIERNIIRNDEDGGIIIDSCSPLVEHNRVAPSPYRTGIRATGYAAAPAIRWNEVVGASGTVGVASYEASPLVENNTIVGHRIGLYLQWYTTPTYRKNIITGCVYGIQISWPVAPIDLACNDFWNNTDDFHYSAWGCDTTRVMHADPLFCDAAFGDYSLSCYSPCANSPECGLVGAFGVACGQTAVTETTWGRIKTMFR
jgi:parallel beta-helix repeat protein